MMAKDLADRGVGDSMAELEQFTLNPALAPTRVFTGHANDQAAYLLCDRRATTTGSASESRPAAADQFPVPAQDGGSLKYITFGTPRTSNPKGRAQRPEWAQQMAARHRKTLIVCRTCHEDIDAGRPIR